MITGKIILENHLWTWVFSGSHECLLAPCLQGCQQLCPPCCSTCDDEIPALNGTLNGKSSVNMGLSHCPLPCSVSHMPEGIWCICHINIIVLNVIQPSISWVDAWILSLCINGNPDELTGKRQTTLSRWILLGSCHDEPLPTTRTDGTWDAVDVHHSTQLGNQFLLTNIDKIFAQPSSKPTMKEPYYRVGMGGWNGAP